MVHDLFKISFRYSRQISEGGEATLEDREGVKPVLRWAGGKRRLVHRLVKLLPPQWNTYVEPMAGGAALFFHLDPDKALLADINSDLINFYRVLKNDTSNLVSRLASLRPSKALYNRMRNKKPKSRLQKAVRFAYLNRLCWNGLHRVNRRGSFNVPIGDRRPKRLFDRRALYQAAELLQNAKLLNADFETTLRRLKRGDFAFIDPPYPRGAREGFGFNRYASDFFSLEDHKRLGRIVRDLDNRGAHVMILLAASQAILQCYPSHFQRVTLQSKSLIASKSSSRRTIKEIALTNYLHNN